MKMLRRVRRSAHSGTKRCHELYADSVEMLSEEPCDASSGECVYKAFFRVNYYNGDQATMSFDWTTSVGTTPKGHNNQEVEVWIRADHNIPFDLSCTITDKGKTSFAVGHFESRNI